MGQLRIVLKKVLEPFQHNCHRMSVSETRKIKETASAASKLESLSQSTYQAGRMFSLCIRLIKSQLLVQQQQS